MTLHRTPIHHLAAAMVRNGAAAWQPGKTAGGGWFIHANGMFPNPDLLVALSELLHQGLIERRGTALSLTAAGEARLAEWDATVRAVKR